MSENFLTFTDWLHLLPHCSEAQFPTLTITFLHILLTLCLLKHTPELINSFLPSCMLFCHSLPPPLPRAKANLLDPCWLQTRRPIFTCHPPSPPHTHTLSSSLGDENTHCINSSTALQIPALKGLEDLPRWVTVFTQGSQEGGFTSNECVSAVCHQTLDVDLSAMSVHVIQGQLHHELPLLAVPS